VGAGEVGGGAEGGGEEEEGGWEGTLNKNK